MVIQWDFTGIKNVFFSMKKAMGFFSQQDGISPTSRYNWITGGYPLNAGHDGRHSNLFG